MKISKRKKLIALVLGLAFSGAVYAGPDCNWFCKYMGPNPICACQISV